MPGCGVGRWGYNSHRAVGGAERARSGLGDAGGGSEATATLVGRTVSGVQPFVTPLAQSGVDGNAFEVGGSSIPTGASLLIDARGRGVTEVAWAFMRAAVAVAEAGPGSGGAGWRVGGSGIGVLGARTLASELVTLELDLADHIRGIEVGVLGPFFDVDSRPILNAPLVRELDAAP